MNKTVPVESSSEPRLLAGGSGPPARELWNGPWYVKWSARILSAGIVQAVALVLRLLSPRSPSSTSAANHSPSTVLLTAGSASQNWLKNHLLPLASSDACRRVLMVVDKKMNPLPKVVWIVPPNWLQKIIGRTPARLIVYLIAACRHKPDICGGFHLLVNGMLALVTARWIGARALYFCVGGMTEILGGAAYNEKYPFGRTGRMDRVLEQRLLGFVRQFDAIVTMGTGAKKFLESRGVNVPVEAIPGGIDAGHFSPNGDAKIYDLIVTCRLVPVKRLDLFLKVVREVSDCCPDIRAVIVGDGGLRVTLTDLAASLGITDRVVFAGHQENVADFLRKSRLFLLTSDSEGLALSLMEAMMCGLPAVTSDVGDLSDLVKNDVNGWLVPRRDVSAFAEKIAAVLKDENLYRRLARQARQHAIQLSISTISNRWTKVLCGTKQAKEYAS